jgi:hypothetical protein
MADADCDAAKTESEKMDRDLLLYIPINCSLREWRGSPVSTSLLSSEAQASRTYRFKDATLLVRRENDS